MSEERTNKGIEDDSECEQQQFSLTLSKSEMSFLSKTEDELSCFNKRLMQVRRINLQNSFIEATNTRLSILKKIRKWIELLEVRIFDHSTIMNLDIDKVIVLLKLAMRYTDRILTQIQCSEKAMKMYAEIDNLNVKLENIKNAPGIDNNARNELKEKMLKAVMSSLSDSISDIEVVEQKKVESLQADEQQFEKELGELEKEINESSSDFKEEKIIPNAEDLEDKDQDDQE